MMTPEERRALLKASKKWRKASERRLRARLVMDRWTDKVENRMHALGEGVERIFGFWADHCIAICIVLLILCFVPGLEIIAGFLLAMHILLPGVFVLFLFLFGPYTAAWAFLVLFLFGLAAGVRLILVDVLHLL